MSCDCSRHFGDVAMIVDIIITRARPKLSAVEAGTAEFDYMLAALVFDLARKNALLHKALRKHLLHADPDLTREVLSAVDQFEALGQDYQALARTSEELMLRAVDEVLDDHMQMGRTVVRWDEESGAGA
ncbi:MAG TPA: hypothetical protein VM198_04340 [Longimicrobiales bacterium]|nr:hypothetical protein [Longimicrobiales bacterium]